MAHWSQDARPRVRYPAVRGPGWLGLHVSPSMATTRAHHAARRHGGSVAAGGAGAASRPHAAHRGDHLVELGRSGRAGAQHGIPAGTAAIGLDRRPQHPDRPSLGRGRCRQLPEIRGGAGRARARCHPRLGHRDGGTLVAGDAHRADRIRAGRRSGRGGLRRKPGAARWQRDRIHAVRIRLEREMARAAQGDRPARDASGGPSRPRPLLRDRPVRRDPVGCTVGWGWS